MNRKLVSKAFTDIDDAFILETLNRPASQTNHMNHRTAGSKPIRTRRLLRFALAACLIFALTATAYAIHYYLGIRDLDNKLPVTAEPYIQQHTEAAAQEDWSAKITESLCDETQILVTVTVSGGDKYIIAPTDADPNTPVSYIGLEGEQTLEEYAREQGKGLLFVGASLKENNALGGIGSQAFRNTSPNEMTILVQTNKTDALTQTQIICCVYAVDAQWNKHTLDIPFSLEEAPSEGGIYVPDIPDAVPGMTAGNATVTETPMGISIRFMQTVTDESVWDNLKKVEFDGIVRGEGGGWVLEDDGNWWFTVSRCTGTVGDTLKAHYYDWDDNIVGTIVFAKN